MSIEDERNAALAVIERIKTAGDWLDTEEAKAGTWWSPRRRKEHLRTRYLNKIDAAVATSPAKALEAVKADALREAANAYDLDFVSVWLHERADLIEKEAIS